MEQIVIVYGSAADPSANPRDIDVAFTGRRETAEGLVSDWAAGRGHGHLPVDWHPARMHGPTVLLPTPCGIEQSYQVLAGLTEVEWAPEYGLAAHIRAYGGDPDRLATVLREGVWRLTVIPAPGADREREYVEGLTALRSAVRKHPKARSVLEAQWPALAARLLEGDPCPREEDLETLRAGSAWASQGAVIILLNKGGGRLEYGGGGEDLAAMLYPEFRDKR